MDKFRGEFAQLETIVSNLGCIGQWEEVNGKKVFRSEDGAILNWWPNTGTLQAQGPATPKAKLERSRNQGPLQRPIGVGRSNINRTRHYRR